LQPRPVKQPESLLWWGRDGKQTSSIAQADRYFYPSLCPDGTRLAVCIFRTQGAGDGGSLI
jgi:hypothetical protein